MYQTWSPRNINPTLRDLVTAGYHIFNDWWDTYVPEHRAELEKKIIHTYYFEQIGSETPDQFIHYINAHLERIMPYYNQLYASELMKINPLLNHAITVEGRTIENLVTKANTSDDKIAKAIREFAGVTDTAQKQNAKSDTVTSDIETANSTGKYKKVGAEDVTDHSVADGTEKDNYDETKIIDGKTKESTSEEETFADTTTINKTVTETPGEQITKKTDWGGTETIDESTTGQDKTVAKADKNWTETLDDTATTATTTNLSEHSTNNGRKDYSDTPQKQLLVGEYGEYIREDYLTNATWTSETSSHTADTTQNVNYKDDQTKEHNETQNDNTTTDKTQQVDTTKTKGGSDVDTTTRTGTNVTATDETDNSNKDRNLVVSKDTTTDDTTTTESERNITTKDEATATKDKDWSETGEDSASADKEKTGTASSTNTNNTTGTTQNKETSNTSQATTSTQEKTSEETTDTGNSTTTSGFMNVSSSALLEAFRRTFLNIDSMIIEELRNNFMLVY